MKKLWCLFLLEIFAVELHGAAAGSDDALVLAMRRVTKEQFSLVFCHKDRVVKAKLSEDCELKGLIVKALGGNYFDGWTADTGFVYWRRNKKRGCLKPTDEAIKSVSALAFDDYFFELKIAVSIKNAQPMSHETHIVGGRGGNGRDRCDQERYVRSLVAKKDLVVQKK